jgi:MFS family permease
MNRASTALALIVVLSVATHIGFGGSRMLTALYAVSLEAGAFTVGVLIALYAFVPLFLSVQVGRVIDRLGVRAPLAVGAAAVSVGLALPYFHPTLVMLGVSATVLGVGFMIWQVAASTMAGAIASAGHRARNYAVIAMGYSVSGLLGPVLAGVSIDGIGYLRTYLLLAAFPLAALAGVLVLRRQLPRLAGRARAQAASGSMLDLWRIPALKRTFVVSGCIAAAWDLYTFYLPVYARSLGLSASAIGVIMATFAAATFVVRIGLPWLVRRQGEARVLAWATFVCGAAYLLFPVFGSAWMLALASFLLGLGCGVGQPVSMTLIYNLAPKGRAGEGTGVRVMINQFTHVTVPIGFGGVAAAAGYVAVFAGSGALLLGAGAYFARSLARGRD